MIRLPLALAHGLLLPTLLAATNLRAQDAESTEGRAPELGAKRIVEETRDIEERELRHDAAPVYDGQPRQNIVRERTERREAPTRPPFPFDRSRETRDLRTDGPDRRDDHGPVGRMEPSMDQLGHLLDSPYMQRLFQLMENNAELKAELKIQQVEAEAREQIQELQMQQIHQQLERAQKELDTAHDQTRAAQANANRLQGQAEDLKAQLQKLEQRCAEIEKEADGVISQRNEELKKLHERMEKAQAEAQAVAQEERASRQIDEHARAQMEQRLAEALKKLDVLMTEKQPAIRATPPRIQPRIADPAEAPPALPK